VHIISIFADHAGPMIAGPPVRLQATQLDRCLNVPPFSQTARGSSANTRADVGPHRCRSLVLPSPRLMLIFDRPRVDLVCFRMLLHDGSLHLPSSGGTLAWPPAAMLDC